ncbi:MAG: hypothetical protein MH252_05385 [Thermosynechococcaceae cyanobacterium MS004]|nr:hypothetical protein [Thermosynechococcaceae cyanobacterium MS004]
MKHRGYLFSTKERTGRQTRRLYRATSLGQTTLAEAKEKVRELFGELLER